MTAQDISSYTHRHDFLGRNHRRNEGRVWLVIALTAAMMIAEITAGSIYGSMALVADGWHMATHAGALSITALAYLYARKHRNDSRFSFGTGKLGDLGGFASAIILAFVALLIGWESLLRLANPVAISFGQAIAVAAIGLAVNLICAWLLRDDHGHHHHHHGHGDHHGGARDNNLRAAYLHVLADALTSILAIVALLLGRSYGWSWADPVMGVVGAMVIMRWSWSLIRDSAAVLMDRTPQDGRLPAEIRKTIETAGDRVADLHVWQVGPGHHAVIVSLVSQDPKEPSHYKAQLSRIHGLSHVTVEIHSVPSA
ncbi:CDF family Co(II)/Ni(II) efflux transporter DmeF [Paracoccus alkanivorans]|uniref:Cation transporter n=1 Tax=Paracoccus alkanivorans TaxID=2116655 RepID=A0A3M0MJK9_9RHOB|nr:CDF family Co(II)/Ni(II) efflux transporter DmeF [Paracoccus alkanivorans]RMC37253.1 cation transporter [Paracoccus alkanivorans]